MKCVNCYREIADGLKFCPKCGFMQPHDREAYELEHPELAEALPEDEILEQVNTLVDVPSTALSREEFVQLMASDPHCDSIVKIADEGVEKYGLVESGASETWYAKCAELIDDKQGFYPYFVRLLFSQPDKARNLLYSQVADDMKIVQPSAYNNDMPSQMPETGVVTPPSHPVMPSASLEVNAPVTPVPPDNQKMVECPICHQLIAYGSPQCPYCKQLLDWTYSIPDNDEKASKKNKRGPLKIALAFIAVLLIGGAGYLIYSSSQGPTGNPRKDAKRAVNEMIDLIEDADISTKDDIEQLEDDIERLQDKYENYYRKKHKLEKFKDEINELGSDPEIRERYEEAIKRYFEQVEDIDYSRY